jgi:hypothetical protein
VGNRAIPAGIADSEKDTGRKPKEEAERRYYVHIIDLPIGLSIIAQLLMAGEIPADHAETFLRED